MCQGLLFSGRGRLFLIPWNLKTHQGSYLTFFGDTKDTTCALPLPLWYISHPH